MGIYSTKKWWQRLLIPITSASVEHRIQPDFYSTGGIVCSILAGLALYAAQEQIAWLWVVPAAVSLRLIFNLLDGLVARQMQVADQLGELKNEFGDRLSDFFIFLGLALGGYANFQLVFTAFSLILLSSYLGILAKALTGQRMYLGIFGKGDRMLSLAAFCLIPLFMRSLDSFNYYLAFASAAAAITILQRLWGIRNAAKPAA